MAFFYNRGNNPVHGRDEGPPPPAGGRVYGGAYPGQYQYQYLPGQGHFPQGYAYPGQNYYFGQPVNAAGGAYWPPGQVNYAQYTNTGQYAQPGPRLNPDMPAANMTNTTGGVGCEPGYNYFFHNEHTKIHVLKTGATPPWQMPRSFTLPFHACHVPTNTTLAQLLKGFGATNPEPKLNQIHEVYAAGDGRWYKGLTFAGDDEAMMAKTVKAVGWDETRTGLPHQKPVVYIYITKD